MKRKIHVSHEGGPENRATLYLPLSDHHVEISTNVTDGVQLFSTNFRLWHHPLGEAQLALPTIEIDQEVFGELYSVAFKVSRIMACLGELRQKAIDTASSP